VSGKAITFSDVMLSVAPENHINNCKNRNVRLLLNAKEIVFLELFELRGCTSAADVVKCRD
jgi:hypothetical protein